MARHGTETDFELTTIERLTALQYEWTHGEELERSHEEVVLRELLKENLARRYPDLPQQVLDEAVRRFARPEGVDTLRRNQQFHKDMRSGIEVKLERPGQRAEHRHIYAIDWEQPENNEFRVVNQLPVKGQNDRRPDIVIFVNGLPLIIFELKNPWSAKPTVTEALNQVRHYRHEIPQLFEFNAVTVVSDGVNTLHGMWSADEEWFAPWKSIDGLNIEPGTTASMKALIEGLFPKERLLEYVRDFILFEVADDIITKKGAKYHQFFAVRIAAQKTIEAVARDTDKRIGVIWHTTGSGKSLSMAFFVGLLRREPRLSNPTFLVQVDRTDLDDQLHDQFVAARSLVGDVKHADSVDELRDLLRTEGGEVIFTTVEKFQLKGNRKTKREAQHPVLSKRSNIIVIADEAHRSQYGFLEGYARYLNEALPNARRIGFTGTPVSLHDADTVKVFGDVIHTYDIRQSQEDGATVPIYYEARQIKLHLNHADVDTALGEIVERAEIDQLERKKTKWAALARAAGSKERVEELAADLLHHFKGRTATLAGKAMVVCMTRPNCVRLYEELTAISGCPEVKVVMTGNLGKDPEEWSKAGHYTTKAKRDAIKRRMVKPEDPLKIVIVCDMWLTGTDIPCLHTLYIDKPMRGHNMIQAISRVNRVFRDKPHGLVVDYIGIGDELREATSKYSQSGGKGEPAPAIDDEARPLFLSALEAVRALLPAGIDYGDWRRIASIALEDRYALVYGTLTESDDRRDEYLQAEHRVTNAYLLVKSLDDCRPYADEIIFYQRVRKQLLKAIPGRGAGRDIDHAVRDLVDDAVETQGVVDIFESAGLKRADISILDDQFLQTFKDKPHQNLRLTLLQKLLADEIRLRHNRNVAQARSFRELLESTLRNYHNRLIDAAAVIQTMLRIKQDMDSSDMRAKALGLEEEELAFYDAVAANYGEIYGDKFLAGLIHEVVQTVKRNLKVDWTEPHRDDIKATIRAAVKRVLRKNNVRTEDLEEFTAEVLMQAEALYADWPVAA